ncbi:hypothetical protein I79_008435 [Cricetulus griseus]|uniref:Uncharacterized protein n=1 Tax=Cricetulus griseus TaxID=10029 RepID=G3HD60_CRIGR|nr:hypothetical protein I79_008435 [Cricetulus griseus]
MDSADGAEVRRPPAQIHAKPNRPRGLQSQHVAGKGDLCNTGLTKWGSFRFNKTPPSPPPSVQ